MFSFLHIRRLFLGMAFVYMATMMIVMGNGHSFLGRYLSFFYTPVANAIGLNTTWNFFSPDPAQTMYFRYDVIYEDAYGNPSRDAIEGFYPESKDQGGDFRLDKRRNAYALRWLVLDPDRIKKFFIPWKCRENPGATKIQVELIVNHIPSIDERLTLKNESFEDLVRPEEVSRVTYECPHV